MGETNKIVVEAAGKEYLVEDSLGKPLGTFIFNPTDTNIVRRYEEAVKFLEEMARQDHGEDTAAIFVIEDEIKAKIDYMFGADVSGVFFASTGPLTILESGNLFVANVVNALAAVIEAEINVRVKKMEKVKKAVSKYTDKYENKGV